MASKKLQKSSFPNPIWEASVNREFFSARHDEYTFLVEYSNGQPGACDCRNGQQSRVPLR